MVSFDWKYKDEIRHCSECGKQMSSFQIGTDELKSSDDPTKGMCSDCRDDHQDEEEEKIRRLESRLANIEENKRLADEEIRNLLKEESNDFPHSDHSDNERPNFEDRPWEEYERERSREEEESAGEYLDDYLDSWFDYSDSSDDPWDY